MSIGLQNARKKAASLPDAPGVYLFKDGEGKVIYVGKATSLRKRVGSYFRGGEGNPRLSRLRARIADVDFIVTANEVEALILEANLIKRYRPDYNILFRDDKSYPYMVICVEDTFPRVMFARGQRRRDAVYYGPFAHAGAVRETMDTLRKVFPFRACRGREPGKSTGSPCLDYHIGLCCGPCTGEVPPQKYRAVIGGVREFMEGRHDIILEELRGRMREEASRQEYELAARTRDRIAALERILERQEAHSLREGNHDVFAVHGNGLDACVALLHIRGGKILGKQDFFTEPRLEQEEKDILAALLTQFYAQATSFPREVLLSHDLEPEERLLLQDWLSGKAGRKVQVLTPRRGRKRSLVEMALSNARHGLEVHLARQASDLGWISRAVEGIREGLGLDRVPYRIECYDISNLGPDDAVGSMVVYEGGLPVRRDFRRFRIRGASGPNDVAMIEEVLDRRLAKLASGMEEAARAPDGRSYGSRNSFHKKPDLILVDGGAGQLAAALKALDTRGFGDIKAAAMAKRLEEIHLPGKGKPVVLPRGSEALHLLQRIRDDAHRYALEYHRQQRERRTSRSLLDDIPGVGPKRKKLLLRRYGSVARVADAPLEELRGLSFLDRRTAENVYYSFGKRERPASPVGGDGKKVG